MIPCSNMTSEVGLNQDKYVPASNNITEKKLEQFQFLGNRILELLNSFFFFG
jgi:hypothetical protein